MDWERILNFFKSDRPASRYPESDTRDKDIGTVGSDSEREFAQDSTRVGEEYGFESFVDAVDTIKQLKRAEDHNELERVLWWCINDTEADAAENRGGVGPYYYEQLAILYRKQGRNDDEVDILERYQEQPHAPGKGPEKLAKRLERARELATK